MKRPFLELVFAACWRFQDLMDSSYRMEDPPNGKHVSLAVPLFVLPASLSFCTWVWFTIRIVGKGGVSHGL
jgi:hypothetical protein